MRLHQIVGLLRAAVLSGEGGLDVEIRHCFAADLMSDVLAFSTADAILVTGLTGIQSLHAADVADLKAIVYVHGKRPPDDLIELARGKGIPLLSTPHNLFDACGILHAGGIQGA